MTIDSIGFDLDGTLWNSLSAITEAWNITAKEYNIPHPTTEDMKSVMGLNKIDLMKKLFPDMPEKYHDGFFARATEICNDIINKKGGILYDNLESTLEYLSKRINLFIVSNCQNGYIESFLAFHKLGKYFCDFECSGTKCLPKGENIKSVIERNGFKKSVYVGDTQGDADAAMLADVPFILASYGFGNAEKYDYIIYNFEQLKDLVK